MKTSGNKTVINSIRILGFIFLASALILILFNVIQDAEGKKSSQESLKKLNEDIEKVQKNKLISNTDTTTANVLEYAISNERPMPEVEIDGQKYIGVVRIAAVDLELPVISQCSYDALQIAPARYSGSVYLNNMVIAAHNYLSHFGRLKELQKGDIVTFTDVEGTVYSYSVDELDILEPSEIDEMTSGEWELTLFTCTVGGASRVTVRCNSVSG